MPLLSLKNLPRHDCLMEAARKFPGMDPSACGVLLYLLRTGDEAFRVIDENFSANGLSEGRFTVLTLLIRRGEGGVCGEPGSSTPAELAEFSGVTRATMTGLIDTLERDGLVVRKPDPVDRRMMNVHITPKGRQLIEGMQPEHFRRLSHLVKDLTEDERATLMTLLGKVLNAALTVERSKATGAPTPIL